MVLADDHAATRGQLCQLLAPSFDVVAVVSDGRELVDAATRLSPDAIIADISMPSLDGIDAAREILAAAPDMRIVLVTVHDERILVDRALAAGVMGYVLKDAAGEELVGAVTDVLGGRRHVSRVLTEPGDDWTTER